VKQRASLIGLVTGILALPACGPATEPLEYGAGRVGATAGTQALQQEDPWLDCLSSGMKSLTIEWDLPWGTRMDRVSEVKKLVRGLRPGDLMKRFWDREQQRPFVRVVRQGRTVLLVAFDRASGGWWASTFGWCIEPGVPTPIYA
jgi:hypothetical protein